MKRLATLVAAALTLVPLGGPADAQARREATVLISETERGRKFQERWGYNDAIVPGDTIYLSGIVVALRAGEGNGITEIKIIAKRPNAAAKAR